MFNVSIYFVPPVVRLKIIASLSSSLTIGANTASISTGNKQVILAENFTSSVVTSQWSPDGLQFEMCSKHFFFKFFFFAVTAFVLTNMIEKSFYVKFYIFTA